MSRDSTDHITVIRPWAAVFVWFGVILLTIPFARPIQEGLVNALGGTFFFISVLPLAGLFVMVLIRAFRRDGRNLIKRTAWFLGLAAVSVWVLMSRLQQPIEFIHFFEYGILSALLFVAWRHTIKDDLVYGVAIVSVAIAAYVDELIQWMVPGRYWDYRDILLNLTAGIIIQVFYSQVVIAGSFNHHAARKSVRIFCRLTWLALFLFACSFWITPARVDAYASRIPFLKFLIDNESVIAEYGYRHYDPDIGAFYSRMTIEELAQTDRERGQKSGQIIKESMDTIEYMDFLRIYTPSKDPYLHELRVHLNRREHYYDTSAQYREVNPDRYIHHMTVVYRENQLLEEYFPVALVEARQRLSDEQLKEIGEHADMDTKYVSPVSNHLISKRAMIEYELALLVLAVGIGMIYVRYGRERNSGDGAPGLHSS